MQNNTCSIPECPKKVTARGWCDSHYRRWLNHGDPLGGKPFRGTCEKERFWAKVEKTDTCWNWTASKVHNGYGQFVQGGKTRVAHRISYEFLIGEIPEGMQLDHVCHNRACVSPAHLRLVTPKQNQENRASASKNSTTGIRGVYQLKGRDNWYIQVGHKGQLHRGGYFDTISEAEAAVIELRTKLFTHNDLDRLPAA